MSSKGIVLPSDYGSLEFMHFEHDEQEGIVVLNRNYVSPPFVRIHSSCLFSEAFRTYDCDCARQLDAALRHIKKAGGLVIYLYQEGRGIGLRDKVRAIALEHEHGIDTAAAFAKLGHSPDPRSYKAAIEVLRSLGIDRITLGTNNPRKMSALKEAGITIEKRIRLKVESNPLIDEYLRKKRGVLGHKDD